ncbi:MAG: hypothetical protein ACQETD_04935 [Pseudomonadota bacterium]
MRKSLLFASAMLLAAPVAGADELDNLTALGQKSFRALSQDLAAALTYKAITPAEPLGVTGIDIGIEASATELESAQVFDTACGGCGVDTLVVPKLHLHKGLPANIDVGLMYASVPGSNIELTGAELRYAFVEGGVAMPAVAVRGSYSRLGGVDQLDMENTGVELTVSKGFAMLTPYAGAGRVWTVSDPSAATGLAKEEFSENRYYAGLNLNMGLTNIVLEADRQGDTAGYSLKLGFRF